MSDLDDFKARFRRLVELREVRDIDKQKTKKSEAAYREYEAELFSDLQESGIKGAIGFDFGGDIGTVKFQLRSTTYGKVIDQDVAIESLRKEGLDELIYQTAIRERRLNELVRDRLESRQSLPDGIDYYPRNGISISRKG